MTISHHPRTRAAVAVSAFSALALTLTACAGSAGSGSGGGERGEGYAFGASQEEISAAIEDLEPVTVDYQIPATSMQSPQSPMGTHFKEAVEEMSDGKITVELQWNQSIASYDELHNALADGRVDMAFTLPSYDPARFPAFNALNQILAGDESTPVVGELVTNLAAAELSWNSPEILAEYEENDVTPFVPVMASGEYYTVCTDPATDLDAWQGLQVRVGSPAASDMVSHVGGSPVSIAGVEAYEALQRGTIDCSLAVLSDVVQGGFFEVAPNLGYTTSTSFPRVSGAILTGTDVEQMPLAYQQILFDSFSAYFHGQQVANINAKAEAVVAAKDQGVGIEEAAEDLQAEVNSFADGKRQEVADSGIIGDDILDRMATVREEWTTEVEELGFSDGGSLADMDEWYDMDTDFRPLGDAFMEKTMMDHRPS
ncbi:C4-dicarboxylate ABC transporter substrate-binding protein [Brevibacterium ihuae]|uniref:C4-dicarboxylate ABC transporter substrate-binding protein n=1 Tax=Brevibacterium ihuae TaxID=1631743 RepID=UPI000C77A4AF|nr:C4-dicarboxylate ABC transporter substrate-binding protein [Brevibacterium ihuae]